ncbi:hypothetical protein GF354_00770 [Candidatus Peregrinibacteria bacterium]|nr:hypothetical protein [Candidatus Peregrinibacteria bacterium]
MSSKHLTKLAKLEPGNINIIHKYLCGFPDIDEISSLITNLYELAESERETVERKKRGINDSIFPKNTDWERSFFINNNAKNNRDSKVEHEYFLNLLYSLSFTLFLSKQNHKKFLIEKEHLKKLEYFLSTSENLYVGLDTLAVLVNLTCGIQKNISNIHFSSLKGDLKNNPYAKNFKESMFNINEPPINMLNKVRNMRAHRPFLDWNNDNKIVSKPENLLKVKSVCEKQNLFNEDIDEFIKKCFEKTMEILIMSLEGIFKTYEERLENDQAPQQLHRNWESILC